MAGLGASRLFAFMLGSAAFIVFADFSPPRYSVDLAIDPEHRWDHVVIAERQRFVAAVDSIFETPRVARILPAAKLLLGNDFEARRLLPGDLFPEAQGIARGLGMEMAKVVLIGAFYDFFAAAKSPSAFRACTGIVAENSAGAIFHGRNLDYSFREALSNVTIVVDFTRNGLALFTAVTFGPNPTFNTVVKWGIFSVTQNERDKGRIVTNLWDLVVLGRPGVFARVRQAAEIVGSFDEAVDFFADTPLAAPSYFILGGTQLGQGAVITRDRDGAVDVERLNVSAGKWYLLETNYDHDSPPDPGDDRRHPLERALNATGRDGLNGTSLWAALSITKVDPDAGERAPENNSTIYSTVMQAIDPSSFVTKIRTTERRRAKQLELLV